MQNYEIGEAVGEIAQILAKAYLRYSKLPLTTAVPRAIRSTEFLANTRKPSVHGMTLTGPCGLGRKPVKS
jgi:hypothetical protein